MTAPLIILAGAEKGGCGKALPLTAGILTPFGWKTMGDMRVGMPICGADGKTYAVSGVFPQGIKPLCRVAFTDGTSVDCSPDHLWKTKNIFNWKRDGWKVKTTADLMKAKLRSESNESYSYSIPIMEPAEFVASLPLPIDAYVLGVLIGDGALTSPSRVQFSVPPAKESIKEKIAIAVARDGHHLSGPSGSKDSPQWSIIGKADVSMAAKIKNLGLDCGSKKRFIPGSYKTASVSDRMELLRGLMDTDGTASKGRTAFCTCSERLAADVADIVRSLGGIAIVHSYDRTNKGKPIEWRINVRMEICPFSLDYKAKEWLPASNARGKYIQSIEEAGEAEQQCISTTAPDHLFITDGYNATHNTQTCRALCDYMDVRHVSLPAPRVFDSQYPKGDLVQFRTTATVINVTNVQDQMRVFDALEGVTIVDIAAGLLGYTLGAFDEAGLLDDVKAGNLRIALLHVIGPTITSLNEIADATRLLGASASHFIVKNHINETNFFEWDKAGQYASSLRALESVTINVPHLDTVANESVQEAMVSFSSFAGDARKSRTLRGKVNKWLNATFDAFDRVGLGRIIEEASK
jgi:hypothetical protein